MAGRRRLDGETVPQPDDVSMNASPKIKQTKLEKIRPTRCRSASSKWLKKGGPRGDGQGRPHAFLLDHAFPARPATFPPSLSMSSGS